MLYLINEYDILKMQRFWLCKSILPSKELEIKNFLVLFLFIFIGFHRFSKIFFIFLIKSVDRVKLLIYNHNRRKEKGGKYEKK